MTFNGFVAADEHKNLREKSGESWLLHRLILELERKEPYVLFFLLVPVNKGGHGTSSVVVTFVTSTLAVDLFTL